MTKQQQALHSAEQDAAYVLQPLIGEGTGPVPLAATVERILRISLTDAGLPVTVNGGVVLRGTTVQKEAQRIAAKMVSSPRETKLRAA